MPDDTLAARRRRWPIDHVKIRRRDVPVEELLADVCRVAAEIGTRTVTTPQYKQRGQFDWSTLISRCGSWNAVLLAAGLETARQSAVSETELMENFADVWIKLGRQPTGKDLRRSPSRYSDKRYISRFGTFTKVLQAFAAWIGANITPSRKPLRERPYIGAISHKRTPRKPNLRQRSQVLLRDGAACQLCGARSVDGARLEIDHIIPWSKGGETVLDNLQVLCKSCNRGKWNITDEATTAPAAEPTRKEKILTTDFTDEHGLKRNC